MACIAVWESTPRNGRRPVERGSRFTRSTISERRSCSSHRGNSAIILPRPSQVCQTSPGRQLTTCETKTASSLLRSDRTIHALRIWIPAFAGMTNDRQRHHSPTGRDQLGSAGSAPPGSASESSPRGRAVQPAAEGRDAADRDPDHRESEPVELLLLPDLARLDHDRLRVEHQHVHRQPDTRAAQRRRPVVGGRGGEVASRRTGLGRSNASVRPIVSHSAGHFTSNAARRS